MPTFIIMVNRAGWSGGSVPADSRLLKIVERRLVTMVSVRDEQRFGSHRGGDSANDGGVVDGPEAMDRALGITGFDGGRTR